MQIISKLNMDLCRQESVQRIWVMQADTNTRSLEIRLYKDGIAWPIPEGVRGALGYRKPDGTAGLYDKLPDGTDAVMAEENGLTVILVPQMLTVAGLVRAVITLYDADLNQVSTFPFEIAVKENPVAGNILSENYCYYTNLDAISKALGDVSGLKIGSDFVSAINILVDEVFSILSEYATQQWVQEGYQPKGDYLLSARLPEAVNNALAQAKATGVFDGADGKSPEKGVDYYTQADKMEMVGLVLDALPVYHGEVESV